MGGVQSDGMHVPAGAPDQLDAFADEALQKAGSGADDVVEINDSGGGYLLAGEGQQLLGQFGRAFGGLVYLLQTVQQRVAIRQVFHGHVHMAEDYA